MKKRTLSGQALPRRIQEQLKARLTQLQREREDLQASLHQSLLLLDLQRRQLQLIYPPARRQG